MQAVLSALKDIPGVIGSFVLTPQGVLGGGLILLGIAGATGLALRSSRPGVAASD